MLSFFPRDVLDEILDLIVSVSEGFPNYSYLIASKNSTNQEFGWLVGCLGLNGPLRQYFSLYRAVFQREGERREK